jgi:hypothetical protein
MPKLTIEVRDIYTKKPIPFVSVSVDGVFGRTDVNGIVTFELPPKDYVVEIRAPFYSPRTERIRLVMDTTLPIQLIRSIF